MVVYSPRILSLATGYGGLELGVELLFPGAQVVCYVEREAYAAANLVARFQDQAMVEAPIWDDVTTFDGKPWRGKVDWIVGGYPCQPFSVAGKRKGTDDSRHLWPAFFRIVGEVSPRFCFFENVANHLNLGFREVARDLQTMGYNVAATLVTAEEVGAPHKRERLFILAVQLPYSECERVRQQSERYQSSAPECGNAELDDVGQTLADTECSEWWEVLSKCNPARKHNGHRVGKKNPRGIEFRGEELAYTEIDDRRGQLKPPIKGLRRTGSPRIRERLDNVAEVNGIDAVEQRTGDAGYTFPPGRNDFDGWRALLRKHPDLAPSIESQIRKPSHGHPYWVDELRLTGNGVVPLQAAYALASLLADVAGPRRFNAKEEAVKS